MPQHYTVMLYTGARIDITVDGIALTHPWYPRFVARKVGFALRWSHVVAVEAHNTVMAGMLICLKDGEGSTYTFDEWGDTWWPLLYALYDALPGFTIGCLDAGVRISDTAVTCWTRDGMRSQDVP